MRDLTGLRMHKLVAIRFDHYEHNKCPYWEVLCDCGRTTIMYSGNFLSGKVKSCGCSRFKYGKKSPYFKGTGDLSSSFVSKIRSCATRRKILFELDVDYLWDLYNEQDGRCALTGERLVLPKTNYEISHGVGTASLDRIDSDLGYVKGNVQWVDKRVNMMKQQFKQDEFVDLCRLVVECVGGTS